MTHAHSDHLHLPNFPCRSAEHEEEDTPRLDVYASGTTVGHAIRELQALTDAGFVVAADGSAVSERLNLAVHPVAALQTLAVGPYQVTAFPANHAPADEPHPPRARLAESAAAHGYEVPHNGSAVEM